MATLDTTTREKQTKNRLACTGDFFLMPAISVGLHYFLTQVSIKLLRSSLVVVMLFFSIIILADIPNLIGPNEIAPKI